MKKIDIKFVLIMVLLMFRTGSSVYAASRFKNIMQAGCRVGPSLCTEAAQEGLDMHGNTPTNGELKEMINHMCHNGRNITKIMNCYTKASKTAGQGASSFQRRNLADDAKECAGSTSSVASEIECLREALDKLESEERY